MTPGRVAGGQMIGGRERQEDDYGIHDFGETIRGRDRILMVLADGMGGHAGGAEASRVVIAQFLDDADRRTDSLHERLSPALQAANNSLADLKRQNPALEDAGCTLVAAAIEQDRLTWISVGDSSLLLCRDGAIRRLNADHSMRPVLADLVEAGRMTAEAARSNPNRNALRSVVSGERAAMVDEGLSGVRLRPGDQVLLASDGLETLSHDDIARILVDGAGDPLDKVIDRLLGAVSRAQARHQDNTTVTLYRMTRKSRVLWRRLKRLAVVVLALVAIVAGAVLLRPYLPLHREHHGQAPASLKAPPASGLNTRPVKPAMKNQHPAKPNTNGVNPVPSQRPAPQNATPPQERNP